MLKLNVNEEKQLNFEIQIGGVQSNQITSTLILEIEGIQYGFPAKVGQESIAVNLPALNTVVAKRLKEGSEVQASLDIIADGHHLTPWTDTFMLTNPLVIEAKIVDVSFKEAPAFKTTMVTTGGSGNRSQGVKIEKEIVDPKELVRESEEDMTERIVNKLAEKLSGVLGKSTEILVKEDKAVEKSAGVKTSKTEKITEEKAIEPQKKVDVKNITEEGVYEYMARAGTKNPKIQQLVYEQAEVAAGSSKPVEVLRQVVKLMKSKK